MKDAVEVKRVFFIRTIKKMMIDESI